MNLPLVDVTMVKIVTVNLNFCCLYLKVNTWVSIISNSWVIFFQLLDDWFLFHSWVCLGFQLHFLQLLMKQKAFSCHLQKLLNFLSCGNTDNFTCQGWLLLEPYGTCLNMSNNTQSWRRNQDWHMSQVFSFGKFFQNCTILEATTKLFKMMEENLANFSVFHIGTGLKMSNNQFSAQF